MKILNFFFVKYVFLFFIIIMEYRTVFKNSCQTSLLISLTLGYGFYLYWFKILFDISFILNKELENIYIFYKISNHENYIYLIKTLKKFEINLIENAAKCRIIWFKGNKMVIYLKEKFFIFIFFKIWGDYFFIMFFQSMGNWEDEWPPWGHPL